MSDSEHYWNLARCFQEDYHDVDVLASFSSIRDKTLQSLYPNQPDDDDDDNNSEVEQTTTSSRNHVVDQNQQTSKLRDKSLKGSVDVAILPLVNLINCHSSFATLSSCSGRISLFDPNLKLHQQQNQQVKESVDSLSAETMWNSQDLAAPPLVEEGDCCERVDGSGKGGSGGWIFVSHEKIEAQALLEALDSNSNTENSDRDYPGKKNDNLLTMTRMMSLRFEPMLLHVAAANLERGQRLLQSALQLGFRESGLVVTQSRVTVAIRSYSLALTIPLFAYSGPLQVSHEYLTAFVQEANARLATNFSRIQQLYNAFQNQFLQQRYKDDPVKTLRVFVDTEQCIPNLGLWGHASVLFESSQGGQAEIFVFGGYGTGPSNVNTINKNKGASRSNKVYRLVHDGSSWGNAWEDVSSPVAESGPHYDEQHISCGLRTKPCSFRAREGLKAIDWKCENGTKDSVDHVAVIFGGRTNPANPLSDLLLYDRDSLFFRRPLDIRGAEPAPRWAHTWTKVSTDSTCGTSAVRDIGFLAGGRNETSTFGDFYVLSCVCEQESIEGCTTLAAAVTNHLLWTCVALDDTWVPRPRFHHTAMSTDGGRIVVMGGLSSSNHLLGVNAFDDDSNSLALGEMIHLRKDNQHSIKNLSESDRLCPMFGQASCVIPASPAGTHDNVYLLIGGLVVDGGEESLIHCFHIVHEHGREDSTKHDDDEWRIQPQSMEMNNSGNINFGSLIHHTCHVVASAANYGAPPSRDDDNDRNQHEVVVLGGGVQGFAFGPQFADSFLVKVQISTPTEQSTTITTSLKGGNDGVVSATKMNSARFHHHHRLPTTAAAKNAASSNLETDVVFVSKRNAKLLRTHLEEAGMLDKRYRMTPAAEAATDAAAVGVENIQDCIAVPITSHGLSFYLSRDRAMGNKEEEFWSMVQEVGRRVMPLSTASFAAKQKHNTGIQ
ncbi:hypothetical protein ACA910_005880 [Epithemia clementina (nom. ined.)]